MSVPKLPVSLPTGQARKLYDLEDDFSEDVEGIALRIAATARAGLAH